MTRPIIWWPVEYEMHELRFYSLASKAEVKNCGIARAQGFLISVPRTGMQVRSETSPWMQKHQQHSLYGSARQ